MTLSVGTRIGPYEIVGPLGAGGMGEVYRARDVHLQRDVALKVLPEALALDSARRARFDREARVLAALNHPNIATLYGVEQSSAGQVLVMELVEGHTLADRLALGGRAAGRPVREALSLAQQVATALEAAHEHGIIHRDLKPANIAVRPDGTVKVLDFGLAKTVDAIGTTADGARITLHAEAGTGMGPGTPAYMSPEQARGLPTDKRTDIWAFGCVLYELLTGQRPFAAAGVSDLVARILEREPDFALLPPDTPALVRRLLRRCLEKDPQDRLRDMGDARLEIREALSAGAADRPPVHRRHAQWGWRLSGAAAAVLVTGVTTWMLVRPQPIRSPGVTRFSIAGASISGFAGRALAISSDGTRLLYLSSRGLVVRSRDRLDEVPLQGLAAGIQAPFFSPDAAWVAYADDQTLYKVPTGGGASIPIADVGGGTVGSWRNGEIVFADVRGLFRVSPDGGTPEHLSIPQLDTMEQATYPDLLPGKRAVLFTVVPSRSGFLSVDAPGARIEVLDLDSHTRKTLVRGGSRGCYVRTGHLLYAAGGGLYAAPFDVTRIEMRGNPVQVVSDVANGEFAVAEDGTLAYMTGGVDTTATLVWVDRKGHEEPVGAPPRPYLYPRLSPDGTHVALDVAGPPDRDIWIWDMRRRVLERFTIDPAGNPIAAWSPDGTLIAFGSDRFGPTSLFVQRADGSAEPQRVLESNRMQMPISFAPDGRLLFSDAVPRRGRDIRVLSLDGSRRVESLVHTSGQDATAEVSPDGRWLAYDSNESGEFEVYVRPYPDADRARWQVSVGGGRQPLWSRDGRELFYRDFSGAILSVPVVLTPGFTAGEVTRVLDGADYKGGGPDMSGRTYDVSLDGRRFLMLKPTASDRIGSVVVVLNWFDELKRLAPSR